MTEPLRRIVRRTTAAVAALALVLGAVPAAALVNYDTGQRVIDGVQLLQDASDPSVYYYLPQFPRLATRADGTFEFLCLKYVGGTAETNGGLFHALVEFTLPQETRRRDRKEAEAAGAQRRASSGRCR